MVMPAMIGEFWGFLTSLCSSGFRVVRWWGEDRWEQAERESTSLLRLRARLGRLGLMVLPLRLFFTFILNRTSLGWAYPHPRAARITKQG
ncbi:hypothetical protein VNO80_16030 [Phaseolus coccineus]|uniref:Uncharacterized protein n=1 Tax=Phaseolus coccineus TaxID=3886 RepID=A0AAN9MPY6_PHACN